MAALTTILFDADEVLQYPDPERKARLQSLLGIPPQRVMAFLADLHDAEDTTLTGKRELLEALEPVLLRWDALGKGEAVREWLTEVKVDHAMLEVVAGLRRAGYRCALATNQQPHRARFMIEQLRYPAHFERCFFSCELGVAKPDPAYFRLILADLALSAGEVLFLDDKPRNLAGASEVGIHTEQFVNGRDGRAHQALRQLLERYGIRPAA